MTILVPRPNKSEWVSSYYQLQLRNHTCTIHGLALGLPYPRNVFSKHLWKHSPSYITETLTTISNEFCFVLFLFKEEKWPICFSPLRLVVTTRSVNVSSWDKRMCQNKKVDKKHRPKVEAGQMSEKSLTLKRQVAHETYWCTFPFLPVVWYSFSCALFYSICSCWNPNRSNCMQVKLASR